MSAGLGVGRVGAGALALKSPLGLPGTRKIYPAPHTVRPEGPWGQCQRNSPILKEACFALFRWLPRPQSTPGLLLSRAVARGHSIVHQARRAEERPRDRGHIRGTATQTQPSHTSILRPPRRSFSLKSSIAQHHPTKTRTPARRTVARSLVRLGGRHLVASCGDTRLDFGLARQSNKPCALWRISGRSRRSLSSDQAGTRQGYSASL